MDAIRGDPPPADPQLRLGDFAMAHTADNLPAHGDFSLIQDDNDRRHIVKTVPRLLTSHLSGKKAERWFAATWGQDS